MSDEKVGQVAHTLGCDALWLGRHTSVKVGKYGRLMYCQASEQRPMRADCSCVSRMFDGRIMDNCVGMGLRPTLKSWLRFVIPQSVCFVLLMLNINHFPVEPTLKMILP